MPRGNLQSTTQRVHLQTQRRVWLEQRPELLTRLPSSNDDVEAAHSDALDEALKQMKFYRLYAATTAPVHGRWGIRLIVAAIRGEPVNGKPAKAT